MKDITEFKAWFNNEISQYPLIAKSNPLSLNELCYVLLVFGSPIEKALEDWGHELTEIHTLLGCCELLAGMAEEAAELSQAALKLRRTIDKSNPTPVSTSEASHRLNEEFADVVLCAAALGLDREEVERFIREKAARWSMRLEVDD